MFFLQIHKNKRGFTLIELMIVVSIIGLMLMIGYAPFSSYMARAHVENAGDFLSQEWLIMHEDIRNGLLHDSQTINPSPQAHLFVTFQKSSNEIVIETSTGAIAPRKYYKTLTLESPLEILSFSGTATQANKITYHITPPFATGSFQIDSNPELVIPSGIILEIGYPNSSHIIGKSTQILLRPRYD